MKIGIDPDLKKSGVAIIDNDGIEKMLSLPFFDLTEFIKANQGNEFILENVVANKPTFTRPGANQAVMKRISQNVGQVKAVQLLLVEFFERENIPVTLVNPLRGSIKKAKTNAEYFNRITGWQGRSNADQRDAALLALYGR